MTAADLRTGSRDSDRVGRLLGGAIWLCFLGNPLGALLRQGAEAERWSGLLGLVLFVLVYLNGLSRVREFHLHSQTLRAWSYLALLLVCTALVVPGAGDQSMTCLVFVAALACAILPTWQAVGMTTAVFALTTAAPQVVDGWQTHSNNFATLLAAAAIFSYRLAIQRQSRLVGAEREISDLAVEQERARIARDLHDILGHSLTVISVKAELAERLVDTDPARAHAELKDLQRLSRDALADVRSTAQGIRGISLPGEIASARAALESAGIEPLLPTVADQVPSRWRELFAWSVREGVTNVVRHSQATRCEVRLDAGGVRVTDDGLGPRAHDGTGHGLEGLRQRAALAGAQVTAGAADGGRGFVLTVTVAS